MRSKSQGLECPVASTFAEVVSIEERGAILRLSGAGLLNISYNLPYEFS